MPQPEWIGLPVLLSHGARRLAARSVITSVGRDGRLADRSPMVAMRWAAGQPVDFTVEPGPIVIARLGGAAYVSSRGHLRLPAATRRRARVVAGDRMLVVPDRQSGEVLLLPLTVLEAIITTYRRLRDDLRPPR